MNTLPVSAVVGVFTVSICSSASSLVVAKGTKCGVMPSYQLLCEWGGTRVPGSHFCWVLICAFRSYFCKNMEKLCTFSILGVSYSFFSIPKRRTSTNRLRTKKWKYNQVCFGSQVKLMIFLYLC